MASLAMRHDRRRLADTRGADGVPYQCVRESLVLADGSVELIEHRYYRDGRERVVPLARQTAGGLSELWCGLPVAGRGRWMPIRWLPGPRSVLGPLRRVHAEAMPLLASRQLYEWDPSPQSRRLSARPRRAQAP